MAGYDRAALAHVLANGVAELGFGDNDENPAGRMRRYYTGTTTQIPTYYFRRTFVLSNTASFGTPASARIAGLTKMM